LLNFNPEASKIPVIPPETSPQTTITLTTIITKTVTDTREVEKTTTITIEKSVGYTTGQLVGIALISLVLGLTIGYFVLRALKK